MQLLGVLLVTGMLAGTAASSRLTHFHFNGTLNCPYDSFTRELGVWEWDLFSGDAIGYIPVGRSQAPHHYEVFASDTGDHDLIWHYYEIWFEIYHLCDSEGIPRVLWVDLGSFKEKNGHYYHTKDIELFDKGERISQTFDWILGTK